MNERVASASGVSADDIQRSLIINIANSSLASQKNRSQAESSVAYSPSLVSPPSSAFVSALQSPYISPRATLEPFQSAETKKCSVPSKSQSLLASGSQSEDVPSSSDTPPTDIYEYSDELCDPKLKAFTDSEIAPGRISFSFPASRLMKGSISPVVSNAKLRSCDVYIGFHGHNPNVGRFCKWLKAELELKGIACFIADRAKYTDHRSHEIADRVISSVSHGVVVLTGSSFLNHLSVDEIRFFTQKGNLIPVWFDTDINEITGVMKRESVGKECREAIDGLVRSNEFKLEARDGNWRSCVVKAAGILRKRLGRKTAIEKDTLGSDELPFPRNKYFVGREKEMTETEAAFFGSRECAETDCSMTVTKGEASGQSDGLADEESDTVPLRWVEPVKRLKHKISKSSNKGFRNGTSSIICISGDPCMGKTELALEFAYRYSQRYKRVLWVGGEARYLRQNLLNLSQILGLDLRADPEKDRGRIRSFEEQEFEAFKRVKRELFWDMPYLLIIDNLENEKEWWDGKDLYDLIPRNTGGSHVIITTRLSKVMNYDMLQLPSLSTTEAMILIRGRRRREYPSGETEFLGKFDEKLGRLSFGLWLVGSLLSELAISPSALFRAINQVPLEEVAIYSHVGASDDQFCRNNVFLMKVIRFCLVVLQQKGGTGDPLALKMLLVGAWFSPAPISASLLAAASENISESKSRIMKWAKCLRMVFRCCCGRCSHHTWNSQEESALLLVKLGLAKRANKQGGCWIQLNPIAQIFAKRRDGLSAATAAVQGVRKSGDPVATSPHLWASVFLVFGYKIEPPVVQLEAFDMILFIKKTALPLAITAFTTFSRCTSALELLKVCTNVLEEVEKSFVSQIQDWCHGSLCWKKRMHSNQNVDEYVWQEVTFLKAMLLETRAKLLLRGGQFDAGEELCRTCISIRTVMLGHNHAQTLAAQETLAKLVRQRSKM